MGSNHLPESYIEFCSPAALESLALSRMDEAATLRKEAKRVLRRLVEAEAEVRIVYWMLEKSRARAFRRGRATKIEPAVQPAVLSGTNLSRFAELSAGNIESSLVPVSGRSGLSLPPACSAIEKIRMRRAASPHRASRRRRGSLAVSVRDPHAAGETQCEATSRAQQEKRLSTPLSDSVDFETHCDQIVAVRHAARGSHRPETRFGGKHRHSGRREKERRVLVQKVAGRAQAFEARAPSGPAAVRAATLGRSPENVASATSYF